MADWETFLTKQDVTHTGERLAILSAAGNIRDPAVLLAADVGGFTGAEFISKTRAAGTNLGVRIVDVVHTNNGVISVYVHPLNSTSGSLIAVTSDTHVTRDVLSAVARELCLEAYCIYRDSIEGELVTVSAEQFIKQDCVKNEGLSISEFLEGWGTRLNSKIEIERVLIVDTG